MRLFVLPLLVATTALPAQKPAVRKPANPAKPAASTMPTPAGPTVLFDTTDGRLTCRLFDKEAPQTVALFTKTAAAGKYDGTVLAGMAAAINGQSSDSQTAEAVTPEKPAALTVDHAGTLGLAVADGKESAARFLILDHGDNELKDRMVPFGLCDPASVDAVAKLSHKLLVANNRLTPPVILTKVLIVKPGDPLPPITPNGTAVTVDYGPDPQASSVPAPEPTGPTATITTSLGTITCRLFKETPLGTANFIGLATGAKPYRNLKTAVMEHGKPFYNGLHFGRIIPDFMIQQTDRPGDPGGDLDIGFHFDIETVPGLNFDRPGRMAYANAGPNTNDTEWFITDLAVPRLDGRFTIFGQCDDASMAVVHVIAQVPRDANNKPLQPVTVKTITIH